MIDRAAKLPLRARARTCIGLGILNIILLAGCWAPQSRSLPVPSQDAFNEIKNSVAQLRGLAPKRDFQIEARAAAFAQASATAATISVMPVAQLERAYKQLGLLGANDDLKASLEQFHRLENLIYYDANADKLLVGAESGALGRELGPAYERGAAHLPLNLGIVQALQAQHFGWQEKIHGTVILDARSAYRALAGGDALLSALAYASDGNFNAPSHRQAARQVARQMARLAHGLPEFLRQQLTFPLREGSDFVAWAYKAKGLNGVNALYANPPFTSGQILHPEKYFLAPLPPQSFFPAGLFREQQAAASVEQSLGELAIRSLLSGEHAPALAAQVAAGWRGDQLFSFGESGDQSTVWYSAWGSATEAAAFQRAFLVVAEKRQRMRPRPTPELGEGALLAQSRRGGYALQSKENIVVYVASSAEKVRAVAASAWRDLEVEALPSALRFDSARGPAQLSLTSR